MSRPQKFTDLDIVAAIESLTATGQTVNPMRVRMRLGGGNVSRIKAIIDQRSVHLLRSAELTMRMPEHLAKESERLSRGMSQQILLFAQKCWDEAHVEGASSARDENEHLRDRIKALETDIAALTDHVVHAKGERDRLNDDLQVCTKEREQFGRECRDLKAALHNAESDLRATQKMIESCERNQGQDRDEIRRLQKRIEELVVELTTLKAHSPKTGTSRKVSRQEKVS